MEYFLGVDIGTYGSKATLISTDDGSVAAEASVEHDLSVPQAGWAEHDADGIWWHDFCALTARLLAQPGVSAERITAVGTSAIAPCVLPVDREGKPLRPAILYGIDTRATREVEELNSGLGSEWLLGHAGCFLSSQSAGPKIAWLKRHEPEVWRKTWKVMTSTSYLCYRLTGETVIDHYTAAFYAPLYDLPTLAWSSELGESVCPPEMLPEPRWTTERIGSVSAGAARESGLREGTPVITGTADAAAEAISAGVRRPGQVMVMYGSSLFLIAISDSMPSGGLFWSAPFLFEGTHALAGGMATTGSITQWFRSEFADEERRLEREGGPPAFEKLADGAAGVSPGAEGLLVLPYFSGERTPINDPDARGEIVGLSLRHTREHVYRALLEGVAYGIRHNLDALTDKGIRMESLTATGGGTRNRTWLQIVSDVTNREQTVCLSSGAAHGDALLAGIGVGGLRGKNAAETENVMPEAEVVRPNRERSETYERYYGLYLSLYENTKETVHSLVGLARSAREAPET